MGQHSLMYQIQATATFIDLAARWRTSGFDQATQTPGVAYPCYGPGVFITRGSHRWQQRCKNWRR